MLEMDHGTSYEVLKTINRNEIMTRIAKGKQKGELWDRVILSDGMVRICISKLFKRV